MPAAAALGAAAIGTVGSIVAGNKAAKAQTQAAQTASDTQLQLYDKQRQDFEKFYGLGRQDVLQGTGRAVDQLQPYAGYGPAATTRLAEFAGLQGNGAATAALANDPGYQFRLSQGLQGLDRSAASRGMLLSGAQTKAVQGFGQGLASDEMNNAWNRVAGLQGIGQQASGGISNLYSGAGTTLSNLATGQASQNAQAAQTAGNAVSNAQMAAGNARSSAYQNMGSSINTGINNALFGYGMSQGWFRPQSGYQTTAAG
jgi:hypothetical protein